jgi:hypothetical protein
VMSASQAWFGRSTVKSRFSRFGATCSVFPESVVSVKIGFGSPAREFFFIRHATRLRRIVNPDSRSSRVSRGAPLVPRLARQAARR